MNDLLLGPIIGGLGSNSVNLWGRAVEEGLLYAWLGEKSNLKDAYLAGKSLPLAEDDGYAGVVPLKNLSPNTKYYYTLTLDETPPNPEQGPYNEFITFPLADTKESFAFAFGSCFRPEGESEGQIFQTLENIRKKYNLRFILLVGDQIYADAYKHNGINKIATELSDYRNVYEYAWKRPSLKHLFANLPTFMILDDHEVDDDWYWTDYSRSRVTIPWWRRLERRLKCIYPPDLSRDRALNALKAYWEHQGMHAPFDFQPKRGRDIPLSTSPQTNLYTLDSLDEGSFAYSFTFGAAAFFIMDTRSRRVRPGLWNRSESKTILGKKQWELLEAWLLRVKDAYPVKCLVTSSALLSRLWIDRLYDRWAGFRKERSHLLNFLALNGIEGVYLLSGDLHSSHAVSAEMKGPGDSIIPLWEFCSTPFEQTPNWISKYTFNPFHFGRIKRLQKHFSVIESNFGIVRVDFTNMGNTNVSFEVYGKDGSLLNSVATSL